VQEPGQLSPELVLVDPELARWARARLAVRPVPAAPVGMSLPASPVAALPVEGRSPRDGAFERLLLLAVVAVALAVAFGLALHEWHYAVAASFAVA
jgi:hypothetical protein